MGRIKRNRDGKTNFEITKTVEIREECRYYLTSHNDVKEFAHAVRSHWSIENQLD